MIREYRRLFKTTGRGWRFLCLLLLRAPFDAASTIINAAFFERAFDAARIGDLSALSSACVLFGIASACLFLYNGVIWSIYAPFAARMEGRLRTKLYEKIASFSYQRIEKAPYGEWLTLLNADVEMPFSRAVHLPHAACAIVNIFVSGAMLWRLNPSVFGLVLLFALPHIAISHFLIARAMPKLSLGALDAAAKNTDQLTAFITCAAVSSLYDSQDYLLKRFERSSLSLFKANMKMRARHAASAGILPLFGLGGYLVLLIVSGGGISFGDLTAAFQYRGGILMGSMMLINCLISIGSSMAGIRRINSAAEEVPNG